MWRSYLAGCILLGIAPCTAMVLVWGYLSKGNDSHTLVMVAINSLTMLLLFGFLGGFLLGVGKLPVPWQALLLSIGVYVALPLVAGYLSRKWIIAAKGEDWFKEKFLHFLTPVTITALLITLVLLFSFKGDTIVQNPLTILWIAIPLFIQTVVIFALGYALAKFLGLSYENAAPTAMIGASNHFEVAIATSAMLYGLSSGAALATVVGVLIEVPLMLMLVRFCLRPRAGSDNRALGSNESALESRLSAVLPAGCRLRRRRHGSCGWCPLREWRSSAPTFQGVFWHSHEMVFGFSAAVMTGFLFTAVRNWTGQPTPSGALLGAIVLLWIGARVLARLWHRRPRRYSRRAVPACRGGRR